jgi:hypothetical protein
MDSGFALRAPRKDNRKGCGIRRVKSLPLALAIIVATMATTTWADPGILRPPPVLQPMPIDVDFPGLEPAPSSICVGDRSYRGCCSDHQGVKDITDEYLICKDDAPSRTCAGVTVSLKGCCKDHDGIYGVDTNGVVICNDQTSSPSCKIGLCKNEPPKLDKAQ